MTAWVIDGNGNAHMLSARCRTEDGAMRRLLARIGPSEVRCMGASKEPEEVTAEWLMRSCGKVFTY